MRAAIGSASGRSSEALSTCSTFFTPSSFAACAAAAAALLPATSTCTSPPIWAAAVSALWVASLSGGIVVFGDEEDSHQIAPASLSLATSSAGEPTLMPARRFGGSSVLTTLRRGAVSTP